MFNVLITLLSFLLLSLPYRSFLMMLLPEQGRSWGFAVIFLVSILVSFAAYHVVLKFLLAKIDTDKYFAPLFAGGTAP